MAQSSIKDTVSPQPGAFTIGRDACNDIVVEDSSVSRCHAELRVDADGIVLVDLDSMNGTHVRENGRWIEIARATVKPREPVLLGEVVITPDSLLNRATPLRTEKPAAALGGRKSNRRSSRHDPRPLEMRTATGRPLGERAVVAPEVTDTDSHAELERRRAQEPLQRELVRDSRVAVGPADIRRRRRILMAAIAALALISVGIGAIGWVLLQPQPQAQPNVLSKKAAKE